MGKAHVPPVIFLCDGRRLSRIRDDDLRRGARGQQQECQWPGIPDFFIFLSEFAPVFGIGML
jgi:hypothetical protein